jgi:hypothetical protein
MDGNDFDDDDSGDDELKPHPRIHQYINNDELWNGWLDTVVFIFIWSYDRPVKLTNLLHANLRAIWQNDVDPVQGAAWLADAVGITPPTESHNEN